MLTPSHSLKEGTSPASGAPQDEFYESYQKVAKEFDQEFLKRHGGDLDITLIFVNPAWYLMKRVLIKPLGWTVLCRRFCVHHPGRPSAQA